MIIQQNKAEYDKYVEEQKRALEEIERQKPVTFDMVACVIDDYFPKHKPAGLQTELEIKEKMARI